MNVRERHFADLCVEQGKGWRKRIITPASLNSLVSVTDEVRAFFEGTAEPILKYLAKPLQLSADICLPFGDPTHGSYFQ